MSERLLRLSAPFVAAVCFALLVAAAGSGSTGRTAPGYPVARDQVAKLDPRLGAVVATAAAKGAPAALVSGRRAGIAVHGSDVRVVVSASPGREAAARAAVAAAGGTLVASAGSLSEALVPPSALGALAAKSAVADVRPPLPHTPDAIDEGVHATDADVWQSAGYTGAGVKIGIVDLGFHGYSALLGTALPASVTAVDHCSGNLAAAPPDGSDHGTAVAELVHQMAPGAQLYLFCIDSEVGLAQAEQDAIADGIKIINESASWFNTSRGDGTGAAGTPDAIVADAQAHGILWVNSAGNQGYDHWAGLFTSDATNPDLNDFSPGSTENDVTIAAGEQACAYLKWDDWPVSTEDYDLALVRKSDHTVVADSASDQADSPSTPTEALCYTNTSGSDAVYGLEIMRYSAAIDDRLDLYYTGGDTLTYPVTQSVTEPASSPAALAVGAACWQTGELEFYSSAGPTIDGRTKPDLVAPDSVSTDTLGAAASGSGGCGTSGFAGTSASSPQVAGAAADLLQRHPSYTTGQLVASLEETTFAYGQNGTSDAVVNDDSGVGPLRLGLAAPLGTIAYDAGGTTFLTDGEAVQKFSVSGGDPAWDPSGSELLLADGSGLTEYYGLSSSPGGFKNHAGTTVAGDVQPSWGQKAPYGGTAAFINQGLPGIETQGVGATGTTPTQLTSDSSDHSPVFSPLDSTIAFLRTTGGLTDVWTMGPDGSNPTKLTSIGTAAAQGTTGDRLAWSPDGNHLAVVVGSDPFAIWTVDANGANAHAITTPSGSPLSSAFAPSWSPDGSKLLFADSGTSLDLMNPDGTNVQVLKTQPAGAPPIRTTSWTAANHVYFLKQAQITGTPEVGQTLQAGPAPFLGLPAAASISYEWLRCNAAASFCPSVTGTDASYTLTPADLGSTIILFVVVNDGTTNQYSSSPATAVVTQAPPSASSAPTVSGATSVGSTLTIDSPGSWSGSPAFDYQWRRCASDGGTCSVIADADDAPTYQLTNADSGSTIRADVEGSNDSGFDMSSSLATAVVTGGTGGGTAGGGGGGGGGGSGVPNLKVSWTASNANPAPGSEDDFTVTVANVGTASALQTHLRITLPATVTLLGPPYYERGSGCTGTQALDCYLDYISNGTSTVVKFSTKVSGSGAQLLTATVTSDRESDPSDNSATETIQVGGGSSTPPPPAPKPPLAAPLLKQVKARMLSGVRHGRTELVDGSFTTNEAMKLVLSVTRLGSAGKLGLLKGSKLAGARVAKTTQSVKASAARAGTFSFHVVVPGVLLIHGRTYIVHIGATNAHGRSTTLTVRFRA